MQKYFLTLIIAIILISCGKKKPSTAEVPKDDTIPAVVVKIDSTSFEVDTFHVREEETECDLAECSYCDLYYEKIRTCMRPVHDSVNVYIDSLLPRAFMDLGNVKGKPDLKKLVNDFIKASHDPENGEAVGWGWNHNTSIYRPTTETFSVVTSYGGFMGGAHGNYVMETANFYISDGSRVTMDNLFNDIDAVNKIGLKYFKNDNGIEPEMDISERGWEMGDEGFFLNENFDITTESITWQYNAYEIAAYANGAPSVTIPMKELEKYLKVKFTDVEITH